MLTFTLFQLREDRPFCVILRNLHHSADLDGLKEELIQHGHETTNISDIKHRATRNPMSLFLIDLEQSQIIKSFKTLTKL